MNTIAGQQTRGAEVDLAAALWPHMLSVWLWALFTPVVFSFCSWQRFDKKNWVVMCAIHMAVGTGFAAIDVLVDGLMYPNLLGLPHVALWQRFRQELFINLFSYAGLVAVAHALSYYLMFRAHEVRLARLETMLSEAKVQAIRSHLHPHFLFNTINAAAELVHQNPEAADRMLTRLGQLLQRAFSESHVVEVQLDRELSFAQQYLDIAAIRFGERLESVITASPETARALVPSFLLQPLVENAIRHGVERASTRVRVEITATVEDDCLHLKVSDTGPGLPGDTAALKWRTGLQKVEGLLRELHSGAHCFELTTHPGGRTVAEVTIPFRSVEDSEAFRVGSGSSQASM